ncbi:hypothetical protein SAICODRAFT_32229 [Saitoella complicata NRRL Y-17804]|nr:uncharacterized protein SAICODRAFT_32229 [Saitoella complicata NRRL Y-17804]ODQ49921.1 hypothetical protein SAICODRAFT_32229 [Saitoella complicata NRRL Y-17804]
MTASPSTPPSRFLRSTGAHSPPPTPLHGARYDPDTHITRRPTPRPTCSGTASRRGAQAQIKEMEQQVRPVPQGLATPMKTPARKRMNALDTVGGRTSRVLFPVPEAPVGDIDIFTDSRDRVPTLDSDPSNPFNASPMPSSPSANTRSKSRRPVPGAPSEDGMVYVFRGKKVVRKAPTTPSFADDLEPTRLFAPPPAAERPISSGSAMDLDEPDLVPATPARRVEKKRKVEFEPITPITGHRSRVMQGEVEGEGVRKRLRFA